MIHSFGRLTEKNKHKYKNPSNYENFADNL